TQDLALLTPPLFDFANSDDITGRPLKQSLSKHNVGERVFAVGNPRGLEGTFSEGIISGFRDVGNVRYIQITAPISPGSSGGSFLDDKGEVIGVATATIQGGQNLNLAIELDPYSLVLLTMNAKKSPGTIGANLPSPTEAREKPAPKSVDVEPDIQAL